ncbi:MAG: FAA hydrolase family protein [Candidatus Lokiarchaeota archaeon]|nr:FAA hydrolase family protein [Candidatus Lokiarchaeota archaeon]
MKLNQFLVQTEIGIKKRIGLLFKEDIIDLFSAYVLYLTQETKETKPYEISNVRISNNMNEFIKGGELSLEAAKQVEKYISNISDLSELIGPNKEKIVFKKDEIRFAQPLDPIYFVDFLTFEKHFNQGLHMLADYGTWKKTPVGYKKNPGTVIGAFDDIMIPERITKWLDFEIEFAIIIGNSKKKQKNISKEDAYENVFGYTILNDFSARDMEIPEILLRLGPFKSKDFDTAGPMGPYILTIDEIKGHPELEMELRHNGIIEQKGNTKDMIWKVDDLIEYTSRDQTLHPCTVLCSGNPGRFEEKDTIKKSKRLKPGDIIETEIEKIGLMKNKIIKKN